MMRAVRSDDLRPTTYGWDVRAEGLRVRTGRRMAVDGLDLALGHGVHGLLGPNGAGKTTLVRALATVARPAGGELTLLGVPVTRRSSERDLRVLRRRIGYLPQAFGHYRRFTVREFVAYLAWLKEMPAADLPGAVQRAIERTGLAERADDPVRTLSGGTLRRVGIATAIVDDPQIVLLDEPTAGLDPAQRMRLRELLVQLGGDTCVVVATHLVDDVGAACTGVVLLDRGRVAFHGTPAELAAAGGPDHPGTSALERGYSAVMAGRATVAGSW
jgi:ABC-2 type transport system ATP-binding protein